VGIALAVFSLAAVAFGAAALKNPSSSAVPAGSLEEAGELTPALAAKFATPAPGSKQEGDRGGADDEWLKHATPGNTIPNTAFENSREDWNSLTSHSSGGSGRWTPLGPTWAKSLRNPYRDRSVYNAGTPDFSGRIAHAAIDPNCGSNRGRHGGDDDDDDDDGGGGGNCRLWIANAAGGGVWRTDNALSNRPSWRYLSMTFEHNSTASIELDPNDARTNTLWVGTGEPNGCGSGCEAGVGLYKSTNGGNSWSGPFGQATGPECFATASCNAFYNRAVGSIEVRPGNSQTIFAASGRAIRGLSSACCGGVDALIPGAAHFGLYRSLNGGATWQLVNQGATANCTATHPDVVSLGGTPCSPRGARRVKIDPVDPNTIYASFFARGIWRSNSNGDPGTWQQIMTPVGPLNNNERAEIEVVLLPDGNTRMYVGVGGGAGPDGPDPGTAPDPTYARFLRSDNVRTGAPVFTDLTSAVQDTPGYSSFGYCDGQCIYDNYVFAPAAHFPNSGADADTVYLLGDNEYSENNWGPNSPRCTLPFPSCPDNPATGRSNGRAVLLTTNGGAAPGVQYFTDLTEDDRDDFYPGAQHPDHHALVVNPRDWKQFFGVGDGGIIRSNGRFVDDSEDCVQPKGYAGTRLTFCQLVLSRVPQRLTTLNRGLRTVHFYQLNNSPHDPETIVGGTQDNGSWEIGDAPRSGTNGGPRVLPYPPDDTDEFPSGRECRGHDDDDDDDGGGRGGGGSGGGGSQVWVNTNVADGGHNAFDIGDPCLRLTSFQVGQMMVHYEPKNQVDANWISDTLFNFYGNEFNAFIGVAIDDRVHAHWFWASREHVFRSTNQGRNPTLTKQAHRENCNIWYGDFDLDEDQEPFEQIDDICDDWKPLGDPGPDGRLTSPAYGADRIAQGNYTASIERGNDSGTLWAATSTGRIFVSKNADNPVPTAVVFDRIDNDPTATNDPPRYPTAIYVDPNDSNHAWISYSGFNAKTPDTPGHVFEVRYVPGASTFTRLDDATAPRDRLGDIPATSIAVAKDGTVYVGTDYGCVKRSGGSWSECGSGLPTMAVADLTYVRKRNTLYAATHGQGIWKLRVG
jgi:hypothetical protein